MCLPVLHSAYNNTWQLQQILEFDFLMGADHVFVYNQSITCDVDQLLRWYQIRGVLTVLHVDQHPANQAWYFGQIMAINDCHFRSRYNFRLVAVHDVDEYILPRRHLSWLHLLDDIEQQEAERNRGRQIASFSFRNAFYCGTHLSPTEWVWFKGNLSMTDDEVRFVGQDGVTLFDEMYHVCCYPYPSRSKTIYKPELVKEPGIHRARSYWPKSRYIVVDTDVAFLAHHRQAPEPTCQLDMVIPPFYGTFLAAVYQSSRTYKLQHS